MKKFAISLIVIMVLFCNVVMAESIDLSVMTIDELASLQQRISVEMFERFGLSQTNRIGRGSYVVGKDIKPGYYDFVCFDTDTFNDGSPNNDIYIYALNGDSSANVGERLYWEQRFEIGSHVTFNLEEGTLLEIEGCSGVITILTPDWLP